MNIAPAQRPASIPTIPFRGGPPGPTDIIKDTLPRNAYVLNKGAVAQQKAVMGPAAWKVWLERNQLKPLGKGQNPRDTKVAVAPGEIELKPEAAKRIGLDKLDAMNAAGLPVGDEPVMDGSFIPAMGEPDEAIKPAQGGKVYGYEDGGLIGMAGRIGFEQGGEVPGNTLGDMLKARDPEMYNKLRSPEVTRAYDYHPPAQRPAAGWSTSLGAGGADTVATVPNTMKAPDWSVAQKPAWQAPEAKVVNFAEPVNYRAMGLPEVAYKYPVKPPSTPGGLPQVEEIPWIGRQPKPSSIADIHSLADAQARIAANGLNPAGAANPEPVPVYRAPEPLYGTAATMDKVGRGLRTAGKIAAPIGVALEGKRVYDEGFANPGSTGYDKAGAVAAGAGRLGSAALGAQVGGALGAMTGPLAPVAVPAGAILGGVGGYLLGDRIIQGGRELASQIPASTPETKAPDAAPAKRLPTASQPAAIAPAQPAMAQGPQAVAAPQRAAQVVRNGGTTNYTFDGEGNIVGRTDPNGNLVPTGQRFSVLDGSEGRAVQARLDAQRQAARPAQRSIMDDSRIRALWSEAYGPTGGTWGVSDNADVRQRKMEQAALRKEMAGILGPAFSADAHRHAADAAMYGHGLDYGLGQDKLAADYAIAQPKASMERTQGRILDKIANGTATPEETQMYGHIWGQKGFAPTMHVVPRYDNSDPSSLNYGKQTGADVVTFNPNTGQHEFVKSPGATQQAQFSTPQEVRQAFQSGKLSREQARQQLAGMGFKG